MSINFSKIQSVQGGPYDGTHRNIDFVIPEGVYDLSKSHVSINVQIDTTDVDGEDLETVYLMNCAIADHGSSSLIFKASALIRNCDLYGSKVGMIESIKDVNVLRSVLDQYQLDEDTKIEDRIIETNSSKDQNNFNNSQFRIFKKDGDSAVVGNSETQAADIMIPLKDIFGIGDQIINTERLGELKIHLEINFDKFARSQGLSSNANIIWDDGLAGSKDAFDDIINASGNAFEVGQTTGLTTSKKYDNVSDSPFWLGQRLLVQKKIGVTAAGHGAAANSSSRHRITKIDINDDGSLTLFFSTSIEAALANLSTLFCPTQSAGDAIGGFKGVGAGSSTLTINGCELVMGMVNDQMAPAVNQYYTYATESDNGNAVTHFNKNYQVEPEADALIVAYPAADLAVRSAINYNNYRFMVDNEYTTNRDVPRDSPLHHNRLQKFFNHIEKPLRSINEKIRETADTLANDDTTVNLALFETLPMTNNFKQVMVHTDNVAINHMRLYKRLNRSI